MKLPFFSTKQKEPESEPEYEDNGRICALCGQTGADKKWGGQYWHKKCMRKARKMAKGML